MYFMLECYEPLTARRALIDYVPDDPPDQIFGRDWNSGMQFGTAPITRMIATIPASQAGEVLEMHTATLPLMTVRLAEALKAAGVDNIDYYSAEIHDEQSGVHITTHLAFNIVGTVAAANLKKSILSGDQSPMIAGSFDSLTIDSGKVRGAKLFRLAEAVMGIVVHESVKRTIERAGIDTLTFVPPAEWIS